MREGERARLMQGGAPETVLLDMAPPPRYGVQVAAGKATSIMTRSAGDAVMDCHFIVGTEAFSRWSWKPNHIFKTRAAS